MDEQTEYQVAGFIKLGVILFIGVQIWFWIQPIFKQNQPMPTATMDHYDEFRQMYYSSRDATFEAEDWLRRYNATRRADEENVLEEQDRIIEEQRRDAIRQEYMKEQTRTNPGQAIVPIINLSPTSSFRDQSYTPLAPPALPSRPTASDCQYGCTDHKFGCDIKGNVSFGSGEKIYHMPGQKYYNSTVIDAAYGERWFCTESEAIANGWRKSNQ